MLDDDVFSIPRPRPKARRTTLLVLAAVLLGAGAWAGDRPLASPVDGASLPGHEAAPDSPAELTLQAQQLDEWFNAAAAEFGVPVELLQAIAFTESRWQPSTATAEPGELGLPPSYGVMGLHDDAFFGRSLAQAARLLDREPEELKSDMQLNIRGAAALLARYAGDKADGPLEEWEPAAARLSGIPQPVVARIHTYDVFNAIRLGRRGVGYRVGRRALSLEKIYGREELRRLSAPRMKAWEMEGAVSIQSADYGPAIWNPAAACNYSSGRSQAVTHIAIHIAEGTYAGTIAWFQNCTSKVSAHYVVRSSDGQVTQMVRESDTAWHVGGHNSYSVGIEHEGKPDNCAWYSDAMYNASSALVKDIADSHGIPRTAVYDGSLGFGTEIPRDSPFKIKGHTNFPTSKPCPGECWNWDRYWSLVTSCVASQRPANLSPNNWVNAPANPVTLSYNASAWRWYTVEIHYWNGSAWVYNTSLVLWGNRPQVNFSRGWFWAWSATQWDGCKYGPWSDWAYFNAP